MKHYKTPAAILLTALLFSCGDNQEEIKIPEATAESQAPQEDPKPEVGKKEPKKLTGDMHVQNTRTEDNLIGKIWNLPEVKALSDKIERESKGKRHLVGRISSSPSDDQEYYGISISEDNGEALATYFEFRIYPDNSIYYYDVAEDREMTLKEWRAQKN